jgi:UDP-glucose 4-epimerase
MNILITGGAGYIGSVIAEHCKNNHLHILDDLSTGNKQLINYGIFHRCDIRELKELEKIFKKYKFDLVIHLAAKTRVGESVNNPKLYFDVNVKGTMNLIKTMKKYNCQKIVFASSAAVYGVPKKIPLKEDDIKNPCNPYGLNKLECEQLIINSGLTYGILRFSNVSGASDSLKCGMIQNQPSLLIPIINRLLIKNKTPIIFGDKYKTKDGTCLRDYVHVEDVAKACDLIIKKVMNNKSLIINVCSNKGYSVKDVIKKACLINKKPFKYQIQDNRSGDPDKLILSNKKIKKYLNFSCKRTLNQMIESDFKFILKHRSCLK